MNEMKRDALPFALCYTGDWNRRRQLMKVQCFLCDKEELLDPDTFTAKRIRNRPLTTFLCEECHTRVTANTEKRRIEGRLRPNLFYKEKDNWIKK
jgi:uncharacterized protein YlaI